MVRFRTLVGEPWDPKMDSWTVVPTTPENDAELENYNVVTFDEADYVSPLPLWPCPSSPQIAEGAASSTRPNTPELRSHSLPLGNEVAKATPDQRNFSTESEDISATQPAVEPAGAVLQDHAQDRLVGDSADCPQESDMTEPENPHCDATRPGAASIHGLLLPNEHLQKRLASAISRGSELEAAVEATKIAHHAINEKRYLETKLAEALKKQNQLQRALSREQAERRNAVVAAKELKYTNTTLNVMISDLQAHFLNQQEAEESSARANGHTVTRKATSKPTRAFVGWIRELWLSVGHAYPQLAVAEKHWQDNNPQAALCALHPLLNARQEGVSVEHGLFPPLSELGMLANLLRATIQLAARQRDTALLGIQWMIHEARTAGLTNIERRAQWLRGHALLALDRPREARACFGFCAGPELPDTQLRAMRQRADEAISNLPTGHPGRQISEDFVQFYYQWTA